MDTESDVETVFQVNLTLDEKEEPKDSYRGHDLQSLFSLAEELTEKRKWNEALALFEKVLAAVEKNGKPELCNAHTLRAKVKLSTKGMEKVDFGALAADLEREKSTKLGLGKQVFEESSVTSLARKLAQTHAAAGSKRAEEKVFTALNSAVGQNLRNKVFQNISSAEICAHMGVSLQSLNRVEDAILAYKKAVLGDAKLHVCFANLASLHLYRNEIEDAQMCASKALSLEPENVLYKNIHSEVARKTDISSR